MINPRTAFLRQFPHRARGFRGGDGTTELIPEQGHRIAGLLKRPAQLFVERAIAGLRRPGIERSADHQVAREISAGALAAEYPIFK